MAYDDDLRLAHVIADQVDSLTMSRFKAQDLRVETKPDLTPVSDAERAAQLQPPVRPGQEPQVQVRGTVAPTIHVDPGHAVERPDGPLQAHGHHAQLGGEQIRQVAQIQVGPGLQDQDHRQTGGPVHGTDPPPLTDPDVRLVGRIAGGALPVRLAAAGRFERYGLVELLDAEIALEGKGRPLGEVWN